MIRPEWKPSDIRQFKLYIRQHREGCGPSCFDGDQLAAIVAAYEAENGAVK